MKFFPFIGVFVLSVLWGTSGWAKVELRQISEEERRELDRGQPIERRFELPYKGTKYLAAVSYGVLEGSCQQAARLWGDPVRHLAKALPATKAVELVDKNPEQTRLRVTHGNAVLQGNWGAIYRVTNEGTTARFWLDKNAPRDVKDVFGYFRLSPWRGRGCLVTAAVAVDPGEGLLASMFRSVIHNYLVRSAARIQRYARKVRL